MYLPDQSRKTAKSLYLLARTQGLDDGTTKNRIFAVSLDASVTKMARRLTTVFSFCAACRQDILKFGLQYTDQEDRRYNKDSEDNSSSDSRSRRRKRRTNPASTFRSRREIPNRSDTRREKGQ